LTGTGGFNTEVLVYLATDAKMMCDDRLALRFAGDRTWPHPYVSESDWEHVEPRDFFKTGDLDCSYLCKFKGSLTPAQMSEDLVFQPADDKSDYREHIVEW
jgi:hypothetical protein